MSNSPLFPYGTPPAPNQSKEQIAQTIRSKLLLAADAIHRIVGSWPVGVEPVCTLAYAHDQIMKAQTWLAQTSYLIDLVKPVDDAVCEHEWSEYLGTDPTGFDYCVKCHARKGGV